MKEREGRGEWVRGKERAGLLELYYFMVPILISERQGFNFLGIIFLSFIIILLFY